MGVFPFGRLVVPCDPVATGRAAMFVLGAYPSALHVRWRPPQGEGRVVQALAVDNEPSRSGPAPTRCTESSNGSHRSAGSTRGEPLHRSHISMGRRVSG